MCVFDRLLTTYELIGWPLNPEIQKKLESFRFEGVMIDNKNSRNYLQSNECMIDLFKERIIQHNIRVVAKYYTQISMQRLTNFLGIDHKQSEKFVSGFFLFLFAYLLSVSVCVCV